MVRGMKEMISYGRFRCTELGLHKNRGLELTFVEKGNLEWMVEGRPETVTAGDIFFTLPWQAHGSLNPREPDNRICHVLFHLKEDYDRPVPQFEFPPELSFSTPEMRTVSSTLCASTRHAFRATPAMRWLMPALISELQSNHPLAGAHTVSLLRAGLVELHRIVSGEAVNAETHTPAEQQVQQLIDELSAACDRDWTLRAMTRRCGIQRTHLNTAFKKMTGCTPMEYLTRLRMERAKTLLRETDLKIIDIAFACGFSSSQYFANLFRRAAGLTPSAYRRHCTPGEPVPAPRWQTVGFRSEQEERRRVRRFQAEQKGL
jgi:AraC family L-rhamnose operon regulatory protein RhaS